MLRALDKNLQDALLIHPRYLGDTACLRGECFVAASLTVTGNRVRLVSF
jgi:hypothetical protein